jgi:hypothetical protein
MRAGVRTLSVEMIDGYVPSAILCAHCKNEVDLTTAHHGRALTGYINGEKRDVVHTFHNGQVHAIPVVIERSYPTMIRGWFCLDCYTRLWNITWRDKTNHLKHAFESTPVPGGVLQPKNDDYEASKVTKGLYAPHVVKHSHGRKSDYYETETHDKGGSPVIDNPPVTDRKLAGFNRPKRDDIKTKPSKTIVRKGKWKVKPEEYNYQSPKAGK